MIRNFGAHEGESRVDLPPGYLDEVGIHSLVDYRLASNSREFVRFKYCFHAEWLLRKAYDCLDESPRHRRARVTEFVSDIVTTTYIDFRYGGHQFTIHQDWTLEAFVTDPECADDLLVEVTKLLVPYFGPLQSYPSRSTPPM
jgi:hypothetical protein